MQRVHHTLVRIDSHLMQEVLAKTGDHKFIASEELTNNPEYKTFMESYEASS